MGAARDGLDAADARASRPAMAERGWGRIVNVASSAGKRPSLTNAAYSVTKAAQLSLSRVFADTYAGAGRARQRGRARRRSRAGCGWPRAGSPTRRRGARGIDARGGDRGAGGQGPAGPLRDAWRRSRASSSSCAPSARRWSPAPPGRSTAARSQRSSEAETIGRCHPPPASATCTPARWSHRAAVPHVGGPILRPGAPTVLIDGMPAARVGDMCYLRRPARRDHHGLDEGDDRRQAGRPHGRPDRARRRDRARRADRDDQLMPWTNVQHTPAAARLTSSSGGLAAFGPVPARSRAGLPPCRRPRVTRRREWRGGAFRGRCPGPSSAPSSRATSAA